jgi:hypothetical protein
MNDNKIIHKLGELEITDDKEILVPGEIRYISDWKSYSLNLFQFPHILDKKIPGCGYTEYCITCDIPIILCSPRKILLENKEEQHKDQVFYFRNELDKELDTDKDLTKTDKTEEELFSILLAEDEKMSVYQKLKEGLQDYLNYCIKYHKTPKILVTYDSFRLVKEILKEKKLFDIFHVVVDEFQSIFTDSRFKSTTEMEFINQLKNVQKVCYVSATPMIDKYLQELDLFKDIPYFELDWDYYNPLRTVRPDLKIRAVTSITTKAKEIIKEYKDNKFESYVSKDENGNIVTVESKEAVFYVNSVNNITAIIKGAGLKPDECNILCARTNKNIKKIKSRLGTKFLIGKVPLKGESHKMFTFCTRTVYLGADFYSTNARSFVLSDANIECLAVDISLDLPQILGRQRDLSNPWKNRAEFYYKTLGKKNELTEENFTKIVENKKKKTEKLLNAFSEVSSENKHELAEAYQYIAKTANYKDNYVAVNEHNGSLLYPVVNELVIIAEKRAYDIQQVDYKNRFSVFNTISDSDLMSSEASSNVSKFLNKFNIDLKNFRDKMKLLCEYPLTDQERGVVLDQIPLLYKNYYETLGPERCRALSYDGTYLSREYSDLQFDKNVLASEIRNTFEIGGKYTKNYIKETLKKIYKDLGYNKTPKANDLEEYFEIKLCKVTIETGKQDNGFKIVSIRYQEKVDLDD